MTLTETKSATVSQDITPIPTDNVSNLTVPLILTAQLVSLFWEPPSVSSVLLPLKEFWFFLNKNVSVKTDSGITMESVPHVDQDVPNAQVLLFALNVLPQPTPTIMELASALMDSSSPFLPSDIARDAPTTLLLAQVSLKP